METPPSQITIAGAYTNNKRLSDTVNTPPGRTAFINSLIRKGQVEVDQPISGRQNSGEVSSGGINHL